MMLFSWGFLVQAMFPHVRCGMLEHMSLRKLGNPN